MSAMIHIDGPKDGNFIAKFVTAGGRSLAILVPEKSAGVLREAAGAHALRACGPRHRRHEL